LNEALIGNTSSDRKLGTASVRVRDLGKLTMKFNRTSGAAQVEVKHAKYGSDANSTWELWQSINSGSSWTKVGSTITTSSTSLQTTVFTVNVSGTVRFEIRKVGGGAARINFDDIAISDYTTSGGGGGTTPPPSGSVHLTMGNPSGAITNTSFPANYLLEKAQYAISYNRDKGIANWVSWHLSSSWLGSTSRQDDFRNDTSLPSGWYQVLGSSYSGSGFDRGHMAPSADRTLTVADNSSTFLMTNMIPQAPDNNQGPWANLENYCRTLVGQGNELYIISGGYGQGGVGSTGGTTYTIDGGRVWVPSRTWKVIVVLPNGTNDVARVSSSTRIIAIDMPNQQGIRATNWGTYRTTVDAIEQATGYDFLSLVPSTVQAGIENRVDTGATN
jgi:endonuclease G